MSWLDALKIALIQKDSTKAYSLIESLPTTFDTTEEMLQARELITQVLELLEEEKERTKIQMLQIKAEKKICFDKEIENLRSEVFHSDFSIIHARAGVSSHGVALIPSSKTQPRMLSLEPKLCIVLLKKENVVKSLSEALNLVKKENEILPTNILFIAGPSRTADIELITVFGVHGPQIAHIIIY